MEYENAVMLAHVEGIMAGAGRVDNWNFYISKSLNREARVKEQVRQSTKTVCHQVKERARQSTKMVSHQVKERLRLATK